MEGRERRGGEGREGRRRRGGEGGGPSGDVVDQAFCLKSAPGVPSLNKIFWISTVLDTTRQLATAIPQSLILHKTKRYLVGNLR